MGVPDGRADDDLGGADAERLRGCERGYGKQQDRRPFHELVPRMILALGVPFELRAVEVDLAQVAGRVALGLVVEVRRRGIAALAAGRDGPGAHLVAELDHRDEAVAAGAVPLLRARIRRARRTRRASPSATR